MTETYHKLFGVHFLHNYYKDGRCVDIDVQPDRTTGQLIHQYGYIFRKEAGGFSVFVPGYTAENQSFVTDKTETNLQFNFILSITNPYLMNITELAQINEGSCYLFTNTQIDSAVEGTKTQYFSTGQTVDIQTNAILQEKNSKTDIELIKNGQVYSLQPSTNSTGYFDIKGLDDGVYTLKSQTTEKHIYFGNDRLTTNPFALISIDINDKSILNAAQSMQQPTYAIRLQSKETYWKYIIVEKETTENLLIDLSNNTELFMKTNEVLNGNKPVSVFTSRQKIPITAARDQYFRLKLRNGDPENDLILISKLPLPDITTLNYTHNGDTYSPIYLNF